MLLKLEREPLDYIRMELCESKPGPQVAFLTSPSVALAWPYSSAGHQALCKKHKVSARSGSRTDVEVNTTFPVTFVFP
jgi:hypothetical protein